MISQHDDAIAQRFWIEMSNWSDRSLKRPWPLLFNVFLISSFMYYHLNEAILSDEAYDHLAKHLLNHYDELSRSNVWHLHLIDKDNLRAGTMFDVKPDVYPRLIADIAFDLARRLPAESDSEEFC